MTQPAPSSVTALFAGAGKKVNFAVLASDLMFGRGFNVAAAGLQYRKGKTVEDVKKAREKALNNGRGKTEHELSMLEVYLKEVFKATHVEPTVPAEAATA